MLRESAIIGALLLCAAPHAAGSAVSPPLVGHWIVTGTADAQETTSLSSDDVEKLTGTEIVFTPQSVQFSNEVCAKPSFKLARHSSSAFFRREYKIDPKNLSLPDRVTEVEINCKAPSPISFFYFRDKRHVVFYWKGFFLNAERRIEDKP